MEEHAVAFFLFTSIPRSILALGILSNFLWRGVVTWLIDKNDAGKCFELQRITKVFKGRLFFLLILRILSIFP